MNKCYLCDKEKEVKLLMKGLYVKLICADCLALLDRAMEKFKQDYKGGDLH